MYECAVCDGLVDPVDHQLNLMDLSELTYPEILMYLMFLGLLDPSWSPPDYHRDQRGNVTICVDCHSDALDRLMF